MYVFTFFCVKGPGVWEMFRVLSAPPSPYGRFALCARPTCFHQVHMAGLSQPGPSILHRGHMAKRARWTLIYLVLKFYVSLAHTHTYRHVCSDLTGYERLSSWKYFSHIINTPMTIQEVGSVFSVLLKKKWKLKWIIYQIIW